MARVVDLRTPRLIAILALCLGVGTLAVYWRVLRCDFVKYDDATYTGHPLVQQGITEQGIVWAFTGIHASNWHPLTTISHMLDSQLFGLGPVGPHAINILLHTANTVLLFLILHRMTKSIWRSAFVAALFALHPLHVESVAWVAERKDVLSTFFWMLTTGAYALYTERPATKTYMPVIVLYALGLLAKPMLVTLPITLLLLDYWPLGRFGACKKKHQSWPGWRLAAEKWPLFLLSGIASGITYYVQRKGGATVMLAQIPLGLRISTAAVSCVGYLRKMVLPFDLAVFYPYPTEGIAAWKIVGSLLFLGAVSYGVFRYRRRNPYALVGWLWYLVTLVPVIGLVQVGEQAMADRYTYVPLIGIFMMIAWGIPALLAPEPPEAKAPAHACKHHKPQSLVQTPASPRPISPVVPAIAVVMIFIFALCTWRQIGFWQNRLTLFSHALDVTSANYLAHNMVGASLSEEGKFKEAVVHFNKTLAIKSDDPFAYNNLGNAYTRLGKLNDAIPAYQRAIELKPDSPLGYFNLGMDLALAGRVDEAIKEFSTVISINSGPRGHPEMFEVNQAANDAHIRKLAVIMKTRHDSYMVRRYAMALAQRGRLDEAISYLSQIKSSCPAGESRTAESREKVCYYQDAIRDNTENAEAHYGLGNAYSQSGDRDSAIKEFKKAIELKPGFVQARNNLAVALYFTGRYAEAWDEVHACRKLGTGPCAGFTQALAAKMPDPSGADPAPAVTTVVYR